MHPRKPLEVKFVRDVMIPMPDGIRLAANLIVPAEEGCYPGIFQFTPYQKDGPIGLAQRPYAEYFASHGYAVMQVDFRGTGNSEGTNPFPFDTQEREDGYQVVEWMAAQPWCTGSVGIWGISYGGITALSIASTRPPHLRAIIPIDATVDNYEWLLRTHGCQGLLLCDVDWGPRMAALNLMPPLQDDREGQWLRKWRSRLSENVPWILSWHGLPPDSDFWLRRRIPYRAIEAATFGICGWHDAYTAPTLTVYEEVAAPKRVLIGPWKHVLPDLSPVAPIGAADEMLRWWDRWLKDVDNGVDRDPPVTIYVMEAEGWRSERDWPIARTQPRTLYLHPGGGLATDVPTEVAADQYDYDSRVGAGAIAYNGHRVETPLPTDQSGDDHLSLSYTTAPLESPLEITGTARVRIHLSASEREMNLIAKLCVVDPNGTSRLIAQGLRNPARSDAHAPVNPLRAGELREVTIPLHPTSMVIGAGQRLRLCLAGADVSDIWPTPWPYTVTIYCGGTRASSIELPVVPAAVDPYPAPNLAPPRRELAAAGVLRHEESHVIHQELGRRALSFETTTVQETRIDERTIIRDRRHALFSTDADAPWTSRVDATNTLDLLRPTATISTHASVSLTPHLVHVAVSIQMNGQPFFERSWSKVVEDWAEESPARRDQAGPWTAGGDGAQHGEARSGGATRQRYVVATIITDGS